MRKQMREATKPRPARTAGRNTPLAGRAGGAALRASFAALIAGNAPERRVDRLREFWDLVSARLERDDVASLMARPRSDTRVNKRG
jgi:hypothetical protein